MTANERIIFLQGSKVILRPILKSDLPRITRWINDPEVRRYLETDLPMSEADEEEWFSRISQRKPSDITLAIETQTGEHIGHMGLHRINTRDRTAATGAVIGEKEYWGKGYGTEAKMLLLHYAFNTLNLRKICSQAISFNSRSIAYSKRCGYKEEGILKEHIFQDGQYWDLVQLAVFREDFMSLWERWKKDRE